MAHILVQMSSDHKRESLHLACARKEWEGQRAALSGAAARRPYLIHILLRDRHFAADAEGAAGDF